MPRRCRSSRTPDQWLAASLAKPASADAQHHRAVLGDPEHVPRPAPRRHGEPGERLICTALTGHPCDPPQERRAAEARPGYGRAGWSGGNPHDYDREFCVDRVQLAAFLTSTQPDAAESLALDEDGPARRTFLARLQGEIAKRGTIDVLRHGVRHGVHDLDLFYGTPSAGKRAGAAALRAETASPSSGSFATAATRRSGRSTSGSSSTACRSSRSS